MSSGKTSMGASLLPVVVGGGMAFGSPIGLVCVTNAPLQEGSSGDMAGAAGALLFVLCAVVGFVVALLTRVLATTGQERDKGHSRCRT